MHYCLQNMGLLACLPLIELSSHLMVSTCPSYPRVEHLQYTSTARLAGCYKLSLDFQSVLTYAKKIVTC